MNIDLVCELKSLLFYKNVTNKLLDLIEEETKNKQGCLRVAKTSMHSYIVYDDIVNCIIIARRVNIDGKWYITEGFYNKKIENYFKNVISKHSFSSFADECLGNLIGSIIKDLHSDNKNKRFFLRIEDEINNIRKICYRHNGKDLDIILIAKNGKWRFSENCMDEEVEEYLNQICGLAE